MSESEQKVMDALRAACLQAIQDLSPTHYARKHASQYGDIACVRPYGVSTTTVRNRSSLSDSTCLRALHKLVESGQVLRQPNPGGYTLWWPIGFAKEHAALLKPPEVLA